MLETEEVGQSEHRFTKSIRLFSYFLPFVLILFQCSVASQAYVTDLAYIHISVPTANRSIFGLYTILAAYAVTSITSGNVIANNYLFAYVTSFHGGTPYPQKPLACGNGGPPPGFDARDLHS